MVPPDRSRAPGLAGREGLPEMYLHFRTEFVGSIVQMFVGGCLKMHVNAIHYVLLANRRAIPPNGITMRHLLVNGTPSEKARSPMWILDPGKNSAVENVEGYRIAEEVLAMISSEMQERVYPFAFAEILEELAEPSFAQNVDITREELECIVWLGLDSCFARAYFTQQTSDFDEVLPGMLWLADSAFVHEWSLVKARQLAITAIQNGQIPVQKNWNLWRKWKSLNGWKRAPERGCRAARQLWQRPRNGTKY
jgi:hypothetical protein